LSFTPRARRALLLTALTAIVTWTVVSYVSHGVVYLLVAGNPNQAVWLQRVREYVAGWGRLAPVVYVLAVVAEVVVAPIPGPLLYAPAGAIFGGLLGGTLSLIGNVIGAMVSCLLGSYIGDRFIANKDAPRFLKYRDLLRERGLWVVLLLRANPFTSSDLVSYAAGIAGVPVWKVGVGTLVGMAPLCYLQAYFAERVFDVVPGYVLILGGIIFVVAFVFILAKGWSKTAPAGQ
jgi:uncharacterized membrane protein YdjX (TVP38/TMEM64 family)